jgi:hypothetical protein
MAHATAIVGIAAFSVAAFATLTTAIIIVAAAATLATSFGTIMTTAIVMITPPFLPMMKLPIISAMVGISYAVIALATMVIVAATTIAHR